MKAWGLPRKISLALSGQLEGLPWPEQLASGRPDEEDRLVYPPQVAPVETAFSMPLAPDGTISLEGDCHPLPALAKLPGKRRVLKDIYA